MKHLIYILFGTILALLFHSCEEVIPVSINDGEEKFVIEGKITNQPGPHTVKITKTSAYFNIGTTPRVSNASVIINDVENDPGAGNSLLLVETSPGIYQTDSTYQGEVGKTYYLTVTIDDLTFKAQDYLSPVETLDSVQIKLRNDYDKLFGLFLFGNETPGKGNYYKFDIYTDHVLLNDPKNIIVVDDKFVDGNYIDDFEIYNDTWYHFDEKEKAILKPGVEVVVTSGSLSKTAYDFFLQLFTIANNTGLMFDPPPANPPGNISNGAIGLFYATAVSTAPVVIVPELPE